MKMTQAKIGQSQPTTPTSIRNQLMRFGLIFSLTVGAGGAIFSTSEPAFAATNGCGSRCDGKDPQNYVVEYNGPSPGTPRYCADDAVTKFSRLDTELRYSSFCRTAWAKSTRLGSLTYVTIESFDSRGRRLAYPSYNLDSSWTQMVNDKGFTARACRYEDSEDSGDFELKGCTPKF